MPTTRTMVARTRARKQRKALYEQGVDLAQGHDGPTDDARFLHINREIPMTHEIQEGDRVTARAQKQAQELIGFDFGAPAELFPSRIRKVRLHWRYKRFDTAAEAIRFAIEEMTEPSLLGAYLVVDEARFGVDQIRHLYDDAAYPLKRAGSRS
jgi:hypothetical protein